MQPRITGAPEDPLFRIGRLPEPLGWVPWSAVGDGRFDDPGTLDSHYRVLYAGERRACFLESLARFRPSPIGDVPDVLTRDWLGTRAIAQFMIGFPAFRGRWLDLRAPESLQFLRRELAPILTHLRLPDFDVSVATSQHLEVTQAISRWAFDDGCDGIAYMSRFDPSATCWVIFERPDMLPLAEIAVQPLQADDPDLVYALGLFGLPVPH
jgi:hypothetical protein